MPGTSSAVARNRRAVQASIEFRRRCKIVGMNAAVTAVSLSESHSFSKANLPRIRLLQGLGVEGDAHCGATVQHLSRIAKTPDLPNLRQVHLIHSELHDELRSSGFEVQPGDMGENITTRGIDLLSLPEGARLFIGESVVIEITGLRNPCGQIENFQKGLLAAVLDRDAEGNLVRKSGVMAVIVVGGEVCPGDAIRVELPAEPHRRLVTV